MTTMPRSRPNHCRLPQTAADHLLALDEVLDRLEATSPRKAQLVNLRYFAGFALPEVAEMLGIAQCTAEADWTYAKAPG
jgi:DNA-directed RNA polymerase specialized sigma24 family protein